MTKKENKNLKTNKTIEFEMRNFYAKWKEKAAYYLDKILIYLSVWGFIFSLKFVTTDTENLSYALKYSWLCFLIAIIWTTISYYFSEKCYEKTFQEYENNSNENICLSCKEKLTKTLNIYNILVESLKIISLISFVGGLILLLIYYWK